MNPDSSDLRYIMEKILILDFGSQYTQLIARRVRELNVYCEIHPFNKIPVPDASVRGVILSGSPFSVRDEHAPAPDLSAIKGKLPLLGVCYGAQFLASAFGGEVQPAPSREYGRAMLTVGDAGDPLMHGLPATTQVWMSHGDTITSVPANYKIVASTEDVRVAAFRIEGEQTWGIQFHPEVYHSTDGTHLLKNFVAGICGCRQEWTSESFVEATVRELQEKLGDDKVVLGLSGGVDSSVAAVLLHRAIGKNLYCIFVDSGLLRKNEFEDVLESYKNMGLNVKGVKAGDKFLGDLAGVSDPETKRKIIGRDFVEVFNEEAIRIAAPALQGRGAPRRPFARDLRAADRAPSLPGARPCDPHPGRHHARKGRNPAGRGQNLHRRPARCRALRQGVAGGGYSAPREERRRDGRRANLRELRRTACRDLDRRHDRRLGAPALRVPCQCVERHHQ